MNNKFFKHVSTINKHRAFVRKACFKMGIPWRGLMHDISKYTPAELAICKYYVGNKSPHDNCREKIGYSPSWINHFHKNKHHWEYWCETNVKGEWVPIKIPYKYVIEMFCDFIGAGKAYIKDSWTTTSPLDYWKNMCEGKRLMHKDSLFLIKNLLEKLATFENEHDFYTWYKKEQSFIKLVYKLGYTVCF